MSSEPPIRLSAERAEAPPGGGHRIMVDVVRAGAGQSGDERIQRYELRPSGPLNLLGVFREIYFHHDATFGFRNFECGRGICSTCNVRYEGRVQKGCRLPIPFGSHIRIEPQNLGRSLRDVACVIDEDVDVEDDA